MASKRPRSAGGGKAVQSRSPNERLDPKAPGDCLADVLDNLAKALPAADRVHLEACLLPGLRSVLKPALLNIEAIHRLESEPRPFSLKGTSLRSLLKPNALRSVAGGMKTSRFPKRVGIAGRERLIRLEGGWEDKDYMILNPQAGTYRAWPASFYSPKKSRCEAPPAMLDEILSQPLPARELSTALVRLSLSPTVRGRGKSWIDLAQPPFAWRSDWTRTGHVLPQSYVLSAIQHLGSKLGLEILELPDERLEVTWNGTVLAMREIIDPAAWIT